MRREPLPNVPVKLLVDTSVWLDIASDYAEVDDVALDLVKFLTNNASMARAPEALSRIARSANRCSEAVAARQ